MNTFLAQSKILHYFWSSFAIFLTFTFIIFYPSNLFQTKHHHALINSHYDGIWGESRLFEGEWVRDKEGLPVSLYTNWSCATIPDSKNCFKHGREDTEFLTWRWKPNGCDLPRFDPATFLRVVRGKTLGFIGDSVSRNHADSLICLLSQEEVPMDVYHDLDDRFRTWHFHNHNFTLVILWSKFLVAADQLIINESTTFNLHLDKVDHNWAPKLHTLDYTIISADRWFFKPLYLYQNNVKIGCVHCSEPNTTIFDITFALRMTFRAALTYVNKCTGCTGLTTFVRTFSPAHFENGTWKSGGKCNRIKPLRGFEVESSEFNRGISGMQHEEIERARKESLGLGMNKRFEMLDITRAMEMRADGHPGAHWRGRKRMKVHNDCTHWCLPGPIDVWNDFLMAHLIN